MTATARNRRRPQASPLPPGRAHRRRQPLPAGRRFLAYARLMRLDRPIGAMLLLWPTLWALWLAGEGRPVPWIVAVFVAGVMVMRAAGCVINDLADRDFDPHVERTRSRPIAAGEVSVLEATLVFGVLIALALALVLLLDWLTIALSVVGAGLAVCYPFMKRYTHFPQVFLGVAFAWSVPMAYAALSGAVPPIAWLILTTVAVWAVIYDTMYAMCDRDDDIRIGLKSTAILFGDADRLIVGVLQAVFLLALVLIGRQAGLSYAYFVGVGVAAALCLYQQFLIRHRDRDGCFRGFLNNNWLGAAVFAGIVAHYWLGTAASP